MINKRHLLIYCDIATSKPIISRAIKIALVVGTVLNLINQGEALFSLEGDNIHLLKFLLTYFVPYSVTTYTATALKLEFQIGSKASIDVDLECKRCHETLHVHKNELIKECSHCGIYTKWRIK